MRLAFFCGQTDNLNILVNQRLCKEVRIITYKFFVKSINQAIKSCEWKTTSKLKRNDATHNIDTMKKIKKINQIGCDIIVNSPSLDKLSTGLIDIHLIVPPNYF